MRLFLSRMLVALFVCAFGAFAQEPLTNETVTKLVKAGLGEEVILGMINSQPGKYTLSADNVLALKSAGVSDKLLAAMIKKNEGGSVAKPSESGPATSANSSVPVSEVGVYVKKSEAWTELLPEVVNWKTGGTIKNLASAGVVKKDVNGFLNGPNSRNSVKSPMEFLIYSPEGVAITEYQLIRLRPNKGYREFRTVTGGVFNQKGGALRDLVPFEGKKIANRTYTVVLPASLGAGEYGFLPPGALPSGATHANIGKMYTFRLIE